MARIVLISTLLVWVGCPGPRVDPNGPDPMVPAVDPPAKIPTQPIERGLELRWLSACENWVPSRPCPVKVELSWDGREPLELLPMSGPTPALSIAITPADKKPADDDWRTGKDAVERNSGFGAGDEPKPESISDDQSWVETRELSSFLSVPPPGTYTVFVRYRDGDNEAFAEPRTLTVPEVAVDSGHIAINPKTHASLAVFNDGKHIWLLRGDARYPHGAGSFSEVEGVAGAVFAASPPTETPWIVGFASQKWNAVRLDAEGKVTARMTETYTCQPCTPMTPLAEADGSLLLATRAPRGVLWHRVSKDGGAATALPEWSTPRSTRVELGAVAEGVVSVSWVEKGKRVVGLIGKVGGKAPRKKSLARIKKGTVVYQRVARVGRGGPEVWLVSDNNDVLTAHLRSPHLSRNSKPIAKSKAPKLAELYIAWYSGNATVYARDETNALWSGFDGGKLESLELTASGGFGLFGTATERAIWTVDAKTGFRIAADVFVRMGFGMGAVGGLRSGEVPPQHEKAMERYESGTANQLAERYEAAGDDFLAAAALWNQVPKSHVQHDNMVRNMATACQNVAISYISASADSVLAYEANRLKRSNKACAKILRKQLELLTK